MKKLRIKLNLQPFFQDHRQFAMICTNEHMQTVKDLEEYICKIFNIDRPIYFLCQNHYLIPEGDIDVLRDEDQLYVFLISEALELQKLNESFTQLEALLKKRELQLSRYTNNAPERSSRKRKRCDLISVPNLVNRKRNNSEPMDLDVIQVPEAQCTPAVVNNQKIHAIQEPDVVEKKDKKKKKTLAENEVVNNVESSTDDKKKNRKYLKEVNNNNKNKSEENQSKIIQVPVDESVDKKKNPIIVPVNIEHSSKKSKEHKTNHKEKKKNILIKSIEILANIKTNTNENHLQNATDNNADEILNNPIGETLPETPIPPSSDLTVPKENGLTSPLKSTTQLSLSDVANSPSFSQSPSHNSTEIANCVEPSPAAPNPNDVSFNFEYEFVTKRRRRPRTRRRKGQSPIVEQTPKIIPNQFQPLRTQAAPIQHIKFEKDDDAVNTPATLSIKKESIPEPYNRTDIILKVDHDPTKYPLLDRQLQTHDLIFFKKMKMGEDYTPQISSDILGYVESLSQCGTVAVLDIISGQDEFKEPLGKFSMCEELAEEEQIEENNEMITMEVNALIQPRLVTI